MAEQKNIFQRMLAITAEMQTVQKNLNVQAGRGYYKAVSERDVLDAVKPLEEKHGVYSYPVERELVETQMLESDGKTSFFTRLKTVYRFLNVDNPSEYIDITSFSVGLDWGDKGEGKAMTYGDKYALMKAYKISTGDDPDQTASEDKRYTGKPKAEPAKKKAEPTGDQKIFMDLCGRFGLDPGAVLRQVGWDGYTKVSTDQLTKALLIVKEKSNG